MNPILYNPNLLLAPFSTVDFGEVARSEINGFAGGRGATQRHDIRTSEEWFSVAMETSDEDNAYGAHDEVVKFETEYTRKG